MRIPRTAAIPVLALALAACGGAASSAAATVAGERITVEQVENALARFEKTAQFEQLAQQTSPSEARRQFEQGYLSQIIRRHVLLMVAEERGIEVTDREIDQRLDEIRSDFPNEEEFQKAVDQQGLTESQLRGLVRDQIIEDELRQEITSDVGASDSEVRSYYDEHIEDYRETRARHILVNDRGLAERLSRRLQAAPPGRVEKLFGKLAAEHSEDPGSASNGGDLGYFRPGDFVAEFEDAAAALDVGEVSDPVRSQFGWHVIMVTDRRTAPFEEVEGQIREQLSGTAQQDAFSRFMRAAYERAEVDVNPRFGELDLTTFRVENAGPEDVPGAEGERQETPFAPTS